MKPTDARMWERAEEARPSAAASLFHSCPSQGVAPARPLPAGVESTPVAPRADHPYTGWTTMDGGPGGACSVPGSLFDSKSCRDALMQPDYARLAQQSSDAIFRWMFSTGLTYANAGFVQITGRRLEAMTGDPDALRCLFDPTVHPEFDSVVERLRGGEAASENLVVRLAGDNGGRGWIELALVPVLDGRGQVGGLDGVGRDVSQHLAVADQLSRRTMEQATRS